MKTTNKASQHKNIKVILARIFFPEDAEPSSDMKAQYWKLGPFKVQLKRTQS